MHGQATPGEIEIRGLTRRPRAASSPATLFAALAGNAPPTAAVHRRPLARGAAAVLVPTGCAAAHAGAAACRSSATPTRAAGLALIAARFHGAQPSVIAAVTGTQRQDLGRRLHAPALDPSRLPRRQPRARSASSPPACTTDGALTTPDPVELHRQLGRARPRGGTDHLAMEASEPRPRPVPPRRRGRDGRRLHQPEPRPSRLSPRPWRPHLAAKRRLFETLLVAGGAAVLNADAPEFDPYMRSCKTAPPARAGLWPQGAPRSASRAPRPAPPASTWSSI